MSFTYLATSQNRFAPLIKLPLLESMKKRDEKKPSPPKKPKNEPILPPLPNLVNHLAELRFKYHSKNMQFGTKAELLPKSKLRSFFTNAKWENITFYKGKSTYPHLISEFYCNMSVFQNMDGEKFFTTVLNGQTIVVTHHVLSNAFKLPYCVTSKPNLDIKREFGFNLQEFHLFLGIFYESDVPAHKFNSYVDIPYTHFTQIFQILAMIVRENILPKPSNEMLFDFVDLKVMFQLVINKINFNVCYVILINIIKAAELGYMHYGLLLTSLFDYVDIPLLYPHAKKIHPTITEKLAKRKVSLSYYIPYPHMSPSVQSSHSEIAILLTIIEKLENRTMDISQELENIKTTMESMKEKVKKLESPVEENVTNAAEMSNEYEIQLNNEMIIELIAGDVTVPSTSQAVPLTVLFGDLPNDG